MIDLEQLDAEYQRCLVEGGLWDFYHDNWGSLVDEIRRLHKVHQNLLDELEDFGREEDLLR